ncbi:MAG: lysophospholipid acyltransferase family protein [Acutalibacteraceae bacterium]|nr:lysophospholipid acyltransferase family protein [Acutalibacteraceae bacterium]
MAHHGNAGFTAFSKILLPLFRFYYNPKLVIEHPIPEEGAIIICSNHKHVMDQCMAAIATKRPINYMAKAEYFKGPFAWFFRATGCICVNRNGHDSEAKSEATQVLSKDGALGLFPEGTRNRTDNLMGEFKYGAASLACKNNAKIIPVAVTGDYKFRSKNLMSRIGAPISTEGRTVEEVNTLLKKEIASLISKNLEEGCGTEAEYERIKRYQI